MYSKTDGYVTEKIFNAFLSGSIPIYDGAPNIMDYIFPNSFIQQTIR
jgi:alpha-1,4-fucosyltransferase|tara:strand:- start:198 stop:338 length:141 start_codon:yes stop_codon:yes gene_type:complete